MSTWIPAGPALLFAPADRPEFFAKAADRADLVIIDLEDGCRPANRESAREGIRLATLDPARVIIRVNPAGTSDHVADLAAVAGSPFRQIMLSKTEGAADVESVTRTLPDAAVIALVETPLGVLRAEEIAAAEGVVALFWGAEDLVAGLGGTTSRFADTTYRDVPRFARAQVQLAAAAHGKAALDSVHVDIGDIDGLRAEAEDAAALGYVGTCCIHPSQVSVIRESYRPTDEDLDFARQLLAAAEHNDGAFSFNGRMVDAPLFRQAQAIVQRAES